MLNTCVASTDRNLTTVAALKSLTLGATATSTVNDAYFADLIARSSRWAESYLGFPVTLQTYQEMVAGFGARRLVLARTPLVAVDRVFDATDTGTATQILSSEFRVQDRDAGFLSRNQGWPWTATLQAPAYSGWAGGGAAFPLSPEPVPGDEYEPFLVDYRAGWTLAGVDTGSNNWSTVQGTTSTGRTLPDDLEYGVLLRAQNMFEGLDDAVTAESLGDVSVNYSSAQKDQMTPYEMALAPYRRF